MFSPRKNRLGLALGALLLALGVFRTRGRAVEPEQPPANAGGPRAAASSSPPSFELDVLPVLSAGRCNTGPCHGKSRGQNGFALSLLAFDANFDFAHIVKDGRGRRVFPAAPDNSLLLKKASARLPHGGGQRLMPDSREYAVVREWIAAGMPRSIPNEPRLTGISLAPAERVLAAGEEQPLAVTAAYSDGSTRDVTSLTDYQSNESAVVGIDSRGVVRAGKLPGEATVMARYMGRIATWNTAIPLAGEVSPATYAKLPRNNIIDGLVWEKLEQLRIVPSEPAPDSTYLRRVYLDLIGRLPTADEARAWLNDTAPDKRARLANELLDKPEYADHWANQWADLLRPNPFRVGIKATLSLDGWLRDAFRRNVPYDRFVRDLVTAQGSTWRNGAVTLFRDRREPDELTTIVSQLFLGIRLECAKCHHHPFEVWGQEHFYGFAAYFARLGRKGVGLSPPISGGEEMVFTAAAGSVQNPLTGAPISPTPLFGQGRPIAPGEDPREALADWMFSPDNPYPTQVAVNRIWSGLMGRGLVEPVDDLRATNPASNPKLLAALADEFRRSGYDHKQLLRTITSSYVYGLSSIPGERNVADVRNYSRHYRQRLRAETLLDAVCDITGQPEEWRGMPPGSRATQIWTHRIESLFLDAFGRPDPNQDPPCERTPDATVVQTLHLMNAPRLHAKVTSDEGRAAKLAASGKSAAEIIEDLYLAAYSRFPNREELRDLTPLFQNDAAANRRAAEDLLWALVNTPEFVYKD